MRLTRSLRSWIKIAILLTLLMIGMHFFKGTNSFSLVGSVIMVALLTISLKLN
jgi:hypothetical protein